MSVGRAFDDLVTVGRVVKPQGRRGELLVEPFTDRADRIPTLRTAYVRGGAGTAREVRITGCWSHKNRYVLKLEGVDTIDSAEAFRGGELRIGEEELAALPEGSYYHHQLKGLKVVEPGGRALGTVTDLLETGATPVLVVRGPEGEALIPLAHAFVRRVDLEAGTLVAVAPETVDAAG
jgi:16S rRNA processing protein RimM